VLKFSIIVPVYNTEKYLEECISSVLQQTYPCYELILVDDGSTDSSGSICDYYKNQFPSKVIVDHCANQGQFHARIHAIQLAQGDVVCFLDSDDTLRVDALEKMANAFDKYQCDMVIFEAQECNDFLSQAMTISLDEGVVFQENGKIDLYYKLINSQELNNLWLKAVRREYVNIPASFSSLGNLKHGEDLLLSAQFITATPRIVFVKEGLYHYRVREGSVTHVFSMQRFESVKTVHNELDQYIEHWQMPELKPVHNTTKVSGCVNTFRGLIKNRHTMTKQEFRSHLQALRTDPYFTVSYRNMEGKHLSRSYRLYALCLYHGCYAVPMIWVAIKKFLSKM
jgi:glycosyltransferase involved in cell wall biosynthesis